MSSVSSASRAVLLCLAMASCRGASAPPEKPDGTRVRSDAFRVCADPNNLPFSNDRGEGFENALAALAAADFGQSLEYTWWPQRRGFLRTTLGAGVCDVVMGVPETVDLALTTRPYYRSSYVFVTHRDRRLGLHSLDDARLRELSIGVHVIGDDYANVPPADALLARGIVRNIKGYSIYGNYARPNPPADLIDAVAAGQIDTAIAWGPLGGYFASRAVVSPPDARTAEASLLEVTAVDPVPEVPLQFAISMGVRRDDRALRDRLNDLLRRRATDVDAVLDRFHVPRVPLDADVAQGRSR